MGESTNNKPSFSASRRWGLFFNVFLAVVAVLAFIVMANYLASGYYKRVPLGQAAQSELSPQTLKVLGALTNEVNVTIFFDVHGSPELYGWVSGLLKEYQNTNPRIKVETIDFTRYPGDANVRLAKYKLSTLERKEFVVFESNGQTKTVYANQLSDYDINAVLSGESKEFRRTAFRGEMLFSAAIFAVTHTRALKAYFLTGHGEHDPENVALEGYSKLAALLKDENNVEWAKLVLQGTNEVPADCDLLVIAGPSRAQLSENEIVTIENYLSKGRRLFILLNNLTPNNSGIEQTLEKWGISVVNAIVSDPENTATGNDLLASQLNPTHPVTKSMLSEQLRVQLVLPRPLQKSANAPKTANAPKVEFLAATGTNAVAKFYTTRNGQMVLQQEAEGSFGLIAAIEQGGIKDISAERGATRILVLGDSVCLQNQLLDSAANHYFAGFAVNWLLAQPSILLEGLGPRAVTEYRLNMSSSEAARIRWLFLLGIPGAVLILGSLVWLRRRS